MSYLILIICWIDRAFTTLKNQGGKCPVDPSEDQNQITQMMLLLSFSYLSQT